MNRSVRWMVGVVAITMAVAACGDDTTATTSAATAATTTAAGGTAQVEVVGSAFHPGDLTVTVGTTVTWVNNDGFAHTTTSDDGVWDQSLSSGATFDFTFDTPGTYPYHCNIHRSMHGTITVTG